jgi:hypothetical protein
MALALAAHHGLKDAAWMASARARGTRPTAAKPPAAPPAPASPAAKAP